MLRSVSVAEWPSVVLFRMAIRVMRHRGVILLCLLVPSGCGGEAGGVEPSPPAPINCGISSLALPAECAALVLSCPRSRPADARSIITIATCGYDPKEGSCSPIVAPSCPPEGARTLHFQLASRSSLCVGEVLLQVDPRSDGGAIARWSSTELGVTQAGRCEPVGGERTGSVEVTGPCCQSLFNIIMPQSGFVFRILLGADWTP